MKTCVKVPYKHKQNNFKKFIKIVIFMLFSFSLFAIDGLVRNQLIYIFSIFNARKNDYGFKSK